MSEIAGPGEVLQTATDILRGTVTGEAARTRLRAAELLARHHGLIGPREEPEAVDAGALSRVAAALSGGKEEEADADERAAP